MQKNFWQHKKLSEFTEAEWESICCRCGRCCLVKLQDEDSDEVYYTDLVCRYFNPENCTCTEYQNRCKLVPECLKLDKDNVDKISWMPKNCSYRWLVEKGILPPWHPLITGKPLEEKHSIKNRCILETLVPEEEWEDHILEDEEP